VAALARASGALSVLAHPLSLGLELPALESVVAELAEHGLAGVEATYGTYRVEERRALRRLAQQRVTVSGSCAGV